MTQSDKTYHHGDLKPALINAGIALLEESGLSALSLRGIAARVGVSHTAPKNHFGSLKGLLTAIAAEAWRRHAAAMRGTLHADAPTTERLHAMAQGYAQFALQNPALYQLMLSPLHCDMDDPEYRAAGMASYGVLAEVSAELAAAGGDPAQAKRIEVTLWSLVHGYVTLRQSDLLTAKNDPRPIPPIEAILPVFAGLPPVRPAPFPTLEAALYAPHDPESVQPSP